MKPAALIPAYRPDGRLLELAEALAAAGFPAIVIVDDGSGPEFAGIFASAAQIPNVHVLTHRENRGKGDALKSGLRFLLDAMPDGGGVVTADADGQHHPEDVIRVARRLEREPEALVLGTRAFDGAVPARSRLGNALTRFAFRWMVGPGITDTQTGLRGIPRALIQPLLAIPASGYEFELDMLLAAKHHACRVIEEPVRTIYSEQNRTSHFNPLLDSLKIYFVLLRFSMVSLLTAVIDNSVFFLLFQSGAGLLRAQIAGRAVALVFNYAVVRRAVFRSGRHHSVALPKYIALVVVSGAASYFLIGRLVQGLGTPVLLAKIYAETGLFLINFMVQRDFIFTPRRRPPAATDWDAYHTSTPFTARLARRYTAAVLVKLIKRYAGADARGCLVEIGGANSCLLDRVASEVAPDAYHVIDTNQFGLDLLRRRATHGGRLVLHRHDVLDPPPEVRADLVFSMGLIEHFDPENTARAVRAHFDLLKPGGCAILSFPAPTLLYRAARFVAETAGLRNFQDERPLTREEVVPSIARHARILHERVLWPLVFTQRVIVARKHS